jgi:hypothetical protein
VLTSDSSNSGGGPPSPAPRFSQRVWRMMSGIKHRRKSRHVGTNKGQCPFWLLDPPPDKKKEEGKASDANTASLRLDRSSWTAAPSTGQSAHGGAAPGEFKKMNNLIEKIRQKANKPHKFIAGGHDAHEFIAAVHDENNRLQLEQKSWKILLRISERHAKIQKLEKKIQADESILQKRQAAGEQITPEQQKKIDEEKETQKTDHEKLKALQLEDEEALFTHLGTVIHQATQPLYLIAPTSDDAAIPGAATSAKNAAPPHGTTSEVKYAYVYGPVGDLPVHTCFLLGLKNLGTQIIKRFYNSPTAVSLPYIDDTQFWRVRIPQSSHTCMYLCSVCCHVCMHLQSCISIFSLSTYLT